MWIDYHTHILPGMDDGATDVAESAAMLRLLRKQGACEVVLTPHYHPGQESVKAFLERRDAAYRALESCPEAQGILPLRLGAEVRLERGLCLCDELPRLCIAGTRFLLIELPYVRFETWMLSELENIAYRLKVTPILAHLDRYLALHYISEEQWEDLAEFQDAIVQINAEAFEARELRRPLRTLLDSDVPVVFGTDTHNLTDRAPNGHLLCKVLKKYLPPALLG